MNKLKNIIILFLFISTFTFSQSIKTKFIRSGFLMSSTKSSTQTIKFSKGNKVFLVEYAGNKWWKVEYKGTIGYVVSPYILLPKEANNMKDAYFLEQLTISKKEDSIKHRKDSIINIKNRIKRKNDSILNVTKKKRIDSIKLYIVQYASDSLLKVIIKKGAHLKTQSNLVSDVIYTFKKDEEIMVLDYLNGYYYICSNLRCGYVSKLFFMTNSLISDDIDNPLMAELKRIKEKETRDKLLIELEQKRIIREKEYIKKYGKYTYEKLRNGQYWLGMSDEMARISLGDPDDINRSVGTWGVHEQWIYREYNLYIYFENGKLTSYQN